MSQKTYKIKQEYYVGHFKGQVNSQPRRIYIGVGSEDPKDPCMGEWLTVTQAIRLRDAINEILEVVT